MIAAKYTRWKHGDSNNAEIEDDVLFMVSDCSADNDSPVEIEFCFQHGHKDHFVRARLSDVMREIRENKR